VANNKRLLIFLPVIGGIISRFHGGGFKGGVNKSFKNILWASPFGAVAALSHSGWWMLLGFVALGLCAVGKATGHGRGFRLKEPMKEGSEREKVEYLIFWLENKIPLYWYKVLIMTLVGLAAVLGAVLLIAPVYPGLAAIIALGGAFKGVNAMIFDKQTEWREFADGFVAYSALGYSAYQIIMV
jgi:hypothetical protein